MPTATDRARERARDIAAAQRLHLDQPQPRTPLHTYPAPLKLPQLAVDVALTLPPSTCQMYLLLWRARALYARQARQPWFWLQDSWQQRLGLSLSTRTMARARHDLADRGLAAITTNQGHPSERTWYMLIWPLPPQPHPHMHEAWARDVAAAGNPPRPLDCWCLLARVRSDPRLPELADYAATTGLRPDTLHRIKEADSWFHQQLAWAAPARYRQLYQPQMSLPYGAS